MLAADRYSGAEPLNIGTGDEIAIGELAPTIAGLTGFDGEIVWDRVDAERPAAPPARHDSCRGAARLPRRDTAARRAREDDRVVPRARSALRDDGPVLRRLFTGCLLIAVLAPAASAAAPGKATLSTFAGSWIGHTRSLTMSRSGTAKENVYDGCCDHVIAFSFRLSHPTGTPSNATATVTATAVHVYDPTEFSKSYPGAPCRRDEEADAPERRAHDRLQRRELLRPGRRHPRRLRRLGHETRSPEQAGRPRVDRDGAARPARAAAHRWRPAPPG